MRASGLINFVVITSATACLLAVVTKSASSKVVSSDVFEHLPSKHVLPPDTPVTDLNYDFKDNDGKPPLYDPKSKLYLDNPDNIKTNVEYNPKTGGYDVKQKIGDMDYRPETYMSMKEYQNYQFKNQCAIIGVRELRQMILTINRVKV